MNLLAEKQKRIFDCSISDVERKRREDEFLKLYYQLRNKDETRFLGKMSLQTRKRYSYIQSKIIWAVSPMRL